MATRGRPPKPLDRDSSSAAYLGADLRSRRQERELTQQALADLIGYSPQHISEVERAKAWPTQPFISSCDEALRAHGRFLALLPAVNDERNQQRQERAAARKATSSALRSEVATHSEVAGEDVQPTNRRGLIEAGAAVALGAAGVGAVAATPASVRDIDPELPEHSMQLLNLLGRHDAAFGPRDALVTVGHEIRRITKHREVAHGELRVKLVRVEAHWAEFAAFLSNDAGQLRDRDTFAERALWLAREAGCPDMVACIRMRQGQWAVQKRDARQAIAFAEDAVRVPNTRASTRALCALRAAVARALDDDALAAQRSLADAHSLMATDASAPEWSGAPTPQLAGCVEARCWVLLDEPRKAIELYERALGKWPRDRVRDGGMHQVHLATACAAAGELDRARAEAAKALAIARSTQSAMVARELKRFGRALGAS